MTERTEQRSSRQTLGQEMISTSNQEMSREFDQLFPRRPLHLDLSIDKGTDTSLLLDEFRNTIHNHALELKLQDIRISAAQLDILEYLTKITEINLAGGSINLDAFEGESTLVPRPFPTELRTYVERLTGMMTQGSAQAMEDTAFLYTHAKMSMLHDRAKAIYACFEEEAPTIPPRLLRFEPEYVELFDEQERIEILGDKMPVEEVVERLTKDNLPAKTNSSNQQINATLVLSTLFAGNYAIEEKYPGISPFDATRLLLKNADQLGTASRPKLSGALYMYTITPDKPARGTFAEMVRMATGSEKMTLDDDNRLHLPLPDWSRGMCPLSYSYRIVPDQMARFEDINKKIAATYDVNLPFTPNGELALASQFFVYAALLGEALVNGRVQKYVHDFRSSLPGRTATNLLTELDQL